MVDGYEKLLKKQIVCGYLNSSTPLKISKESDESLMIIEAENRESMARTQSKQRRLKSYISHNMFSRKRDKLADNSLKVFVSGNYLITDNLLDYKIFESESVSKVLGEGKLAHI